MFHRAKILNSLNKVLRNTISSFVCLCSNLCKLRIIIQTKKVEWSLQRLTIKREGIAAETTVNIALTKPMIQLNKPLNMADKLEPLTLQLMSLLMFEESFESILHEMKPHSEYTISDELKLLIAKDWIKPCKHIETNTNSGVLYDSDQLKAYSFVLTAKGLHELELQLKLK